MVKRAPTTASIRKTKVDDILSEGEKVDLTYGQDAYPTRPKRSTRIACAHRNMLTFPSFVKMFSEAVSLVAATGR